MYAKSQSLQDYYNVLRKRWQIVLAVGGGIFGLVLVVTMLATPIYEGTAQIIIERVETDNLTGSNKVQPQDPEFYNTQFQLIRSQAVARRVVDQLGLEAGIESWEKPGDPSRLTTVYRTIGGWFSRFARTEGSAAEEAVGPVDPNAWRESDGVALQISKNVRVRPVQGSHITEISYASPNPEFAALAANTFVRAYLEETLDMKMDATRRNLEWMTQKAEAERIKLQASEKKLQAYMEKNNLVS